MTQVKVFIYFRLTQHVSGIIMPIVVGSFFSYVNDARSHEPEDTPYFL